MNKLLITIITTLLMTATSITFAQGYNGEPGRKGQRPQRPMQAMPVVDQFMRGLRQLDLSEDQKTGVKAVMQGLKETVRPIMQESKAGHMQLRDLIKADNYDETAVAAIAKKEGDFAANRMIVTSQALADVLSLLTDEQRVQLYTMAAKRMAHRGKKERRGEKRKPAPVEG